LPFGLWLQVEEEDLICSLFKDQLFSAEKLEKRPGSSSLWEKEGISIP